MHNYAYIDSQNLNLGIKSMGWKLDYHRFRTYLQEKYHITVAYLFIGYIPENQHLYTSLQKAGFILKFKPTLIGADGKYKGNVDADLVLQAMIDYKNNFFDKAVIITSDGDFYSLVQYLYEQQCLLAVISAHSRTCSSLLKKTAKEKLNFMNNLQSKLAYK